MRLPRITVRGLMGLVIAFGIALHLGLTAYRVHSAKEYHLHTWILQQGAIPAFAFELRERSPFWPRYWRCVLGRNWKGVPLCPPADGRLCEVCDLNRPEIRIHLGGGRYMLLPDEGQLELERRLRDRAR